MQHVRERVAENYFAVEIVQHGVHQREPMGIVDEFATRESFGLFKFVNVGKQSFKIFCMVADELRGAIVKPKVPQAGSLQRSPACSFIVGR